MEPKSVDNDSSGTRTLLEQLRIPQILQKLNRLLNFHQRLNLEILKFHDMLKQGTGGAPGVDKGTQLLLAVKYRELASQGLTFSFNEVEFRNYSQNSEDGILHYIFSLIGTSNRRSVEMCAGSGEECNSANLILHHAWYGLLVDGSKSNVEKGLKFYADHPDSTVLGPCYVHRWINRGNVNEIIREAGFAGEIDLLTIDMDGTDYWIWEAITEVSPRVVVMEFMPQLGLESLTVPYSDEFETQWIPLYPIDEATGESVETELPQDLSFFSRWTTYCGASLPALNKLSKLKGYRLVGANSIGFNAFFVRNDIATELLPEVSESSCFNENARQRFEVAAAAVRNLPWQQV